MAGCIVGVYKVAWVDWGWFAHQQIQLGFQVSVVLIEQFHNLRARSYQSIANHSNNVAGWYFLMDQDTNLQGFQP